MIPVRPIAGAILTLSYAFYLLQIVSNWVHLVGASGLSKLCFGSFELININNNKHGRTSDKSVHTICFGDL